MYHYFMLAKRTFKNQITLPKDIMKNFVGIEYFDITYKENEIILRPVSVTPSEEKLVKVRQKIASLGLTEQDVHDAVRWARKLP